ncbi:MAG TPA: DUF917 domain-containing protein [Gaiellaceae bacterium]
MGQIRSETDADDFLRGANFMSASGGGDPVVEREQLYEDVGDGLEIGWLPLDQLAADEVLFSVCYSGSIAPESFDDPEERAQALGGGKVHERPFVEAVRLLEQELGVRCGGLVSIELGGINSGAILSAAARAGLPLVDGDYAGRAIPELHATAPHMHGAPVLPFACVDHFGNRVIIRSSPSNAWAERISKHLALSSLGLIACAFAALPASRVSEIYVPGTMTECLALGRAIREAREAGDDPIAAACHAIGGTLLFQGTVSGRDWANTGYMEGTHELEGSGAYGGHRLKVWFRNENHVSWLDGEPWVASPDLIEFCDPETGEPLVNTYLELGQEIAVVGRRRRDQFDSPAGLETLGPRHFGFDLEFRGIEQLVAS